MSRFELTNAAEADLDAIALYIARDSPDMARHVLDRLEREIQRVANHPRIGHARRDLGDRRLRVWVVFSYLVVYRPTPEHVEVVRVLHGSRNLRRTMRQGES